MAMEDAADVEIKNLLLDGQKVDADIANRLIGANIKRTIDGAPTLTLQLFDPDDQFVQKGFFDQRITAQIDGKGFELVQFSRPEQGSTLTLVFEDLAVAEMRKHITPAKCEAGSMTRVDFARQLLNEDGSAWIKVYVSPGATSEVTKVALARGTVATDESQDMISLTGGSTSSTGGALTAVDVARYARKAGWNGGDLPIIVAICKGESKFNPLATNDPGDGNQYYGLMQIQSAHKALLEKFHNNWKDPLTNMQMAYDLYVGAGRKFTPWEVFTNSRSPVYYKQYMAEATAAANSISGLQDPTTGATLTSAQRNKSNKEKLLGGAEDTWTAIKKIFAAINWTCYVDYDQNNQASVYVGPDDGFITKTAEININRESPGVSGIGYDYDIGKSTATATVLCRSHRWQLPPGTMVSLAMSGHLNPWLISSIDRSFFSTQSVITLKKPEPALPEPEAPDSSQGIISDLFGDGGQLAASDPTGQLRQTGDVWGSGDLKSPLTGILKITGVFGEKRATHIHKGVDYGTNIGTPVYASRAGTVSFVGNNDPNGYGKMIIIDHDFDAQTLYGHMSVLAASRGLPVKAGDLIGQSGQTGNATGPCLHFELRLKGTPVDPVPYVSGQKLLRGNNLRKGNY